jgi:hypothetical protein
VVESWWAPRSSKSLMGSEKLAMVGSTPIHSRKMPKGRPSEGRYSPG